MLLALPFCYRDEINFARAAVPGRRRDVLWSAHYESVTGRVRGHSEQILLTGAVLDGDQSVDPFEQDGVHVYEASVATQAIMCSPQRRHQPDSPARRSEATPHWASSIRPVSPTRRRTLLALAYGHTKCSHDITRLNGCARSVVITSRCPRALRLTSESLMSDSISWFEAWARWFSTGPLEPRTLMMGWPIYWWSRVGKIAELLGGASILIDIIGPERLREWAKQHRGRTSRWAYWVDFALGGAIGSFVGFKTDTQISNYVTFVRIPFWVAQLVVLADPRVTREPPGALAERSGASAQPEQAAARRGRVGPA